MGGIETYPFDPTGKALSNKIIGEQQIITAENSRDYHFIVPKFAPYFMDSLRIVYKDPTGVQKFLTKGVDWYESHEFISASRACSAPVFGSISFLNTDLSGVVTIDYQTIGGEWVQDSQSIARILADHLHNPRIVAWEQVTELPRVFPPIDHEWDLVDMVGMAEVVDRLHLIEDALRFKSGENFNIHLTDYANPHAVTAAQVGLGSVSNYPMATATTALDVQNNTAYLSPYTAVGLIQQQAGAVIAAHVGDTTNPHHVTAAQVGTYSAAELDNKLNGKLDKSAAAVDSVLFSGSTPAQFTALVLQGTSANSKLFDGKTYMQLLNDIQGGAGGDAGTFNGMFPDQFKAYVLSDGTAYNAARFDGKTYDEFLTYLTNMTALDSNHFGGMTPEEFKNSIGSITVSDSSRFGGFTPSEFSIQVLNGTARNSGKFNEKTEAEFTAAVLAGTAADSSKFSGRTGNDWNSDIQDMIDASATQQTSYMDQIRSSLQASIGINTTSIESLNSTATVHAAAINNLNTTAVAQTTSINGLNTTAAAHTATIGNMSALAPSWKTTLVGAINESYNKALTAEVIGNTALSAASAAQTTATNAQTLATQDATTAAKGRLQLATTAEVQTGTDATKAITPATLAGVMANSLAASGYQKLPSGLIVQWGQITASATGIADVVWPVAYPTAVFAVFASINSSTPVSYSATFDGSRLTVNGARLQAANGAGSPVSCDLRWFSIGK